MITISVTGPESSGKTWLANRLQQEFKAAIVPEYARTYLRSRKPLQYTLQDVVNMAQGQMGRYQQIYTATPSVLIADTDMVVMSIWAREKFGLVPKEIGSYLSQEKFDITLLCKPDIAWEEDELRENEHDRDRLFDLYKGQLEGLNREFVVIEGQGEFRLKNAKIALKEKGYLFENK